MMKVWHYPYWPPRDRPKGDKTIWTWHQVLTNEARRVLGDKKEEFNIGVFAPIGVFHETPMRGHIVPFSKGILIEIELPNTDKMRSEIDKSASPVWVAECIHMIGYFLLVRWCGARPQDGVFWVHAANATVHQVGWAEANKAKGYVLAPPLSLFDHKTSQEWTDHLNTCIIGGKTPSDKFDLRSKEIFRNKFKVHDRVETNHDDESAVLEPAMVKRVLGRRILIEYSEADVDKADLIKKVNMWKDMNDDLIYPVGFAETMGLRTAGNKKYKGHVAAIAKAIKDGEEVPYARMDAKKETVYQRADYEKPHVMWAEDMVCEMIDRLDQNQNLLKAARVVKVLPDGYLQLGPEGKDIVQDSCVMHQSSVNLFPVGYAKAHGIALEGDDGDENFDWDSFLKKNFKKRYTIAPAHFFHEADETAVPFKVGMKLEAIDQNEKMLCPATVKAIKGRLLLVSFDGWTEEFDQLYDYRSNELLPCGWGEMIGHALKEPVMPVQEEADEPMEEDEEEE